MRKIPTASKAVHAKDGSLNAGYAKLSEGDFMRMVIDLAKLFRWKVAHFRPAMTSRGWRTACQADAAGFPDLVLARPPRVIFAELKTKVGFMLPSQLEWQSLLIACPGVEYHLWRPSDWAEIEEALR